MAEVPGAGGWGGVTMTDRILKEVWGSESRRTCVHFSDGTQVNRNR